MEKSIDPNVPESMMKKLNKFAQDELSKDEKAILNAIFDVYNYTIEHKCTVFKDEPAFLKDMENLEEELEQLVAITPTWTIVTLTTTLASHPIITCYSAVRKCE